MTTHFITGKDLNGVPINSANERPFSDSVYTAVLTANAPLTTVVPPNMNIACFSFSKADDVQVFYGPFSPSELSSNILLEDKTNLELEDGSDLQLEGATNDVIILSNADLNPDIRTVRAGQDLTFLSASTAQIYVSFYNRATSGLIGTY